MGGSGFLPDTDDGLLAFALNFSTRIDIEPTVYGLNEVQSTAYTSAYTAYRDALQTARDPSTRTRPAIVTKNTLRDALRTSTRQLAKVVEATVSVTNAQKTELGLNVRKPPAPVPPPSVRPGVDLISVAGRVVTVHIHDTASTSKRAKPAGAIAAWVYTYVGETYPSDPTLWQFQGAATRANYSIVFPDSVPNGRQVWVCAAWVSRRGETGPVSVPITTNLQGGGVSATPMKLAA